MTTATAEPKVEVEFKPLPLARLFEAAYNPRQHFDEEALKGLVESIRAKGVLTPLLVRPVGSTFEIVGGSRRFRAAKQAGLKEVPCQVRAFSDDDALEAAVVDNLQRSDVSPLEEARGYQELLKRGHSAEDLAKKIGKSVRYVYNRLELGKLSQPVLKALDAGKITATHAQLIARLDHEEDQKEALNRCFVASDFECGETELIIEPDNADEVRGLVGVRDFEKTVSAMKVGTGLMEQLKALQIAGHKALLISRKWNSNRQIIPSSRWKSQGAKRCKYLAKGVLVDDGSRGKVLEICITTSCTKHFATHPVSSAPSKADKTAQERREREERAKKARAELDKKVKLEAYRQICNKVREIPRLALTHILAEVMGYNQAPHIDALFPGLKSGTVQSKAKKMRAFTPAQLGQLAIGIVTTSDIMNWSWSRNLQLGDFTKQLGINYAALEKGIRGKFEAERREEYSKLVHPGKKKPKKK